VDTHVHAELATNYASTGTVSVSAAAEGDRERGPAGPARPSARDLNGLLGAVARDETGAFERMFRQLSIPINSAILEVIADSAEAEDVTQDVLAEIWQTACRYDPSKGSALAWALMIARRRALDRLRSAVRRGRRERSATAMTVSWDEVTEAVQDNHDREQLRRGLELLTRPQREAVTLAFYGGHTYAEVAVILGIPVGTAKTRIRSALARLREYMRSVS
jgi:RNA polymerase sigma-70 factor, ECF subfamily